jgi:hypothetical protein
MPVFIADTPIAAVYHGAVNVTAAWAHVTPIAIGATVNTLHSTQAYLFDQRGVGNLYGTQNYLFDQRGVGNLYGTQNYLFDQRGVGNLYGTPVPLPWSLASASYVQNVSVADQGNSQTGIFFNTDGTKMYVLAVISGSVNEYNLSVAWDISTATYSQRFDTLSQEPGQTGIYFKPDGTKMYLVGYSTDHVNEYNLSVAWDISTAVYAQRFSVELRDTNSWGLFFKPDGTKMYVSGRSADAVDEYNLSVAWDISTAAYAQNFSVAAQADWPAGLFFKSDGTKMYVVDYSADLVNEYNLSSAWDISTAAYNYALNISGQIVSPFGLFFKPDGTKMYVVDYSSLTVNEYAVGSPSAT